MFDSRTNWFELKEEQVNSIRKREWIQNAASVMVHLCKRARLTSESRCSSSYSARRSSSTHPLSQKNESFVSSRLYSRWTKKNQKSRSWVGWTSWTGLLERTGPLITTGFITAVIFFDQSITFSLTTRQLLPLGQCPSVSETDTRGIPLALVLDGPGPAFQYTLVTCVVSFQNKLSFSKEVRFRQQPLR